MSGTSTQTLERWGFVALAASLGFIQLHIQAEALFGIAALLWLVIALRCTSAATAVRCTSPARPTFLSSASTAPRCPNDRRRGGRARFPPSR